MQPSKLINLKLKLNIMAGKTPKGKKTRASQAKKKPVTAHERAGLIFGVGRLFRYLRQGRYSDRFSKSSAIFIAGVLEYLCTELLELAGNAAE